MFTEERQRRILALLGEAGRVTVAALAEALAVSDDTVRRDLQALERRGLLVKTHGGALALEAPRLTHAARAHVVPEAKASIGRVAAAEVRAGQTLMLDAGHTVLEAVLNLPDGPLMVVTHALDVVLALGSRTDVRLVLAGGEWDAGERLFHGSATVRQVAAYRADVAIMGACALHPDLGVTAALQGDAEVKQAMLAASARRILVVDHTKLDCHEPHLVAPLDAFDLVVTDRPFTIPGGRPTLKLAGVPAAGEGLDA